MSHRTDRGFTLIELMVVMSIIVILAGIGLTMYGNSVTRAKEAVLKEDLYTLRDVLDQYFSDKGKYPQDLQTLVEEGYLRAIPVDPFTKSADTWQTESASAEEDTEGSGGIYDIHSGSSESALDGTSYSDW